MSYRLIALFVAALAIAGLSFGQGASTGSGGPKSIQLLMRPDVQADLQLSNGQKVQLNAIRERTAKQMKNAPAQGQNMAGMRAMMAQRLEQDNREAEALLSETQRNRLAEIKLQLQGDFVLLDPEVQKNLEFSDFQKSQAQALQAQQQERMREEMRSGSFSHGKMMVVMKRLQGQYAASLMKLLTPEQSAKLKTLKGRPFQVRDNG